MFSIVKGTYMSIIINMQFFNDIILYIYISLLGTLNFALNVSWIEYIKTYQWDVWIEMHTVLFSILSNGTEMFSISIHFRFSQLKLFYGYAHKIYTSINNRNKYMFTLFVHVYILRVHLTNIYKCERQYTIVT